MADESKLLNANTCSEEIYSEIYSELYARSSEENSSMYLAELRKAKTDKQRKACAGRYVGSWQKVLNAWVHGKLPNVYVLDAIRAGFVSEGLLLRAEE
jgi:hypothetical protein